MAGERILVVDDEPGVLEMTLEIVERSPEAYKVRGAEDVTTALQEIKQWHPDLVVLDLNLGRRFDGLEICREIRGGSATSDVAVIVLTGEAMDTAESMLLDAGADDYIRKPHFTPALLASRVRAVLRRTRKSSASTLRRGPLILNPGRREATLDGQTISFTPTEFDILHTLAVNSERAMERHELLDRGGNQSSVDRTVDVHILAIRRKLGRHDWLIETVFGVGYRIGTSRTPTKS
jgi:two-component system phosphate regulon response regulator PhoB